MWKSIIAFLFAFAGLFSPAFGAGTLSLIGVGNAGAPGFTVNFQYINSQNATASPETYNSVPFGTAAPNRYILVSIASIISTAATSTVTIGGVSATKLYTADANDSRSFWIANVPSGTSGSIVTTRSSGTVTASVIGVWSLYGLTSTTPVDANSDGSSPYAVSLTSTNGGYCFGTMFGFIISASPPVDTLSGVTNDGTQAQIYQSGTRNIRGTFGHSPTTGSGCNLTGTSTGTSNVLYGITLF